MPVVGYEGLYEVSNLGRVRSLDRIDRFGRLYKGRILKNTLSCYGYYVVVLCNSGKQTNKRVNRLVAEAFIPNPDNLPVVNHKNEIKIDNRAENLEWCSIEYNSNYGTGRRRMAEKQTNRNDLSKSVACYKNNELVAVYPSQMEAYRKTGICNVSISACCRGELETSGGYVWRFL